MVEVFWKIKFISIILYNFLFRTCLAFLINGIAADLVGDNIDKGRSYAILGLLAGENTRQGRVEYLISKYISGS
jgi:hypothetical protein